MKKSLLKFISGGIAACLILSSAPTYMIFADEPNQSVETGKTADPDQSVEPEQTAEPGQNLYTPSEGFDSIEATGTYTVTYVLHGGTNDSANPTSYTTGDTIYLKAPVKSGFDFKGWFIDPNLDENKAKRERIESSWKENVTFYAKWAPKAGSLPSNIVYTDCCGENVFWTLYTDGRLVIEGSGPMYDNSVGNPQDSLWRNYYLNGKIKSVSFSEGITLIAGFACLDSNAIIGSGISFGSIPSTVTKIGYKAFAGCKDMRKITIPSTVKEIGNLAFDHSGLESLTLPEGLVTISPGAFRATKITRIPTFPSTLRKIGNYAFADYEGSTSPITGTATIPSTVTTVGYGIFEHTNLTSIDCKITSYTNVDRKWNWRDLNYDDSQIPTTYPGGVDPFGSSGGKNGWDSTGYIYYVNGIPVSGFKTIDGELYYFDWDNKKLVNTKEYIGNDYYYFDSQGKAYKNKWYIEGPGMMNIISIYYMGSDGKAVSPGWHTIDGMKLFFNNSQSLQTGCFGVIESDGSLNFRILTAGVTDVYASNYDASWDDFLANPTTSKLKYVTNKTVDLGDDFYKNVSSIVFYSTGIPANISSEGINKVMTFDSNGVYRLTLDGDDNPPNPGDDNPADDPTAPGWHTDSDTGKRFYVQDNGQKATGWVTMSNRKYYFDSDGYAKAGWAEINSKTYYFHPSENYAYIGAVKIGGYEYYFYSDGYMAKNATIGGKYYGPDGKRDVTKENSTLPNGTAKIQDVSLLLDGTVSLKIYFNLPSDAKYIRFNYYGGSYDDIEISKLPTDSETGLKYYIYRVGPKNIRDQMSLSIRNAGGTSSQYAYKLENTTHVTSNIYFTYSVYDYCAEFMNENSNLGRLCKALVNYGDYAKYYFDGGDRNNLVALDPVEKLSVKAPIFEGDFASLGASYVGSSLILQNSIYLNHYIYDPLKRVNINYPISTNAEGKQISNVSGHNYQFDFSNQSYNNSYRIFCEPYSIAELDQERTYAVKNGWSSSATTYFTIKGYTPLVYIEKALRTSNQDLKDLCTALYWYHVYAKAYFN